MTTRISLLLIAAVATFASFDGETSAAKPDKPSAVATDDVQDILYLGRDRIIVVRLHIRVDGRSYAAVWNKYVDDLFAGLDTNNDKALTGKETSGIPTLTQLSRTAVFQASPRTRRLPTTNRNTVDIKPRDGKVTRSELADYLKRAGAKPFTVSIPLSDNNRQRFISNGRPTGSASGKLFDLLDRNSDGKLSKSELQSAAQSIRKHDLDEDETISSAELTPPRNPFYGASRMSSQTNRAASDVFISLASGTSQTRLVRRLLDKYDRANAAAAAGATGKDNKLSAEELGMDAKALSASDADGDGHLDFTELRQFIRKPAPSMELILRVGKRDSSKPLVELLRSSPGLKSNVKAVSKSLANLALASVQIDIGTSGSRSGLGYDPTRTYDRQFDQADTDNNGYLEKKEVERNGVFRNVFSAMDRDKDGKVFKKEMRAYVKSQTAAANSRTVLSITDQGRDLFKILDLNRDQRLSNTELDATIGRIATWDTDNDKQIMKSEIPRQYRLTLERGTPGGLLRAGRAVSAFPGGRRVTANSAAGGPIWFQRMDVNSDGEVSRKEFLGKLPLFTRIDSNNNGRIDRAEAGNAVVNKKPKGK